MSELTFMTLFILQESYKYLWFLKTHEALTGSKTKAGRENRKWHFQAWSFNAALVVALNSLEKNLLN